MKLLLQSEINITSIHCQNLQFKPNKSNYWYFLVWHIQKNIFQFCRKNSNMFQSKVLAKTIFELFA